MPFYSKQVLFLKKTKLRIHPTTYFVEVGDFFADYVKMNLNLYSAKAKNKRCLRNIRYSIPKEVHDKYLGILNNVSRPPEIQYKNNGNVCLLWKKEWSLMQVEILPDRLNVLILYDMLPDYDEEKIDENNVCEAVECFLQNAE